MSTHESRIRCELEEQLRESLDALDKIAARLDDLNPWTNPSRTASAISDCQKIIDAALKDA